MQITPSYFYSGHQWNILDGLITKSSVNGKVNFRDTFTWTEKDIFLRPRLFLDLMSGKTYASSILRNTCFFKNES